MASHPPPPAPLHAVLTRMSLVLLAVLLAVLARRVLLARAQRTRLPPGPKASWFGAVDLPKEYQWLTYAKWKQLYGGALSVRVVSQCAMMVCNVVQAMSYTFTSLAIQLSSLTLPKP